MGVYSGNDVDAAGSAEVTLYASAGTELLGQQVSAGSVPVVIASDQSAVPTSTIDASPATQNITTRDLASSTLSGANGQVIFLGTPTAGSAATFTVTSAASARVQVSGTSTGTLVPEQSLDGGVIWTSCPIHQSGTNYTVSSFAVGLLAEFNIAGATNFRVRATTAITGTAIVKVILSANPISTLITNGINIQDPTSPNNKLGVSSVGSLQTLSDNTGTGTITALNANVVATTRGCSSAVFNVTGTWVATITIQGTSDGSTWNTVYGAVIGTDIILQTLSSNLFIAVPCGGLQQVRLIATAFTSGTASIAWNAGTGQMYTPVFSAVAASFNATVVQGTTPWVDNLTQVGGSSISLAQKTMANSLPVVIASDQTALPVTDNGGSLTIDGTITANAGTGNFTVVQATGTNLHTTVDNFPTTQAVSSPAATLWVTGTAAAGTGVTVTLPAVASQFHYINTIELTAYTAAARIGAATPVLVTSTNLPGSPAWDFSSADAIGTVELKFFTFPAPVKSSTVNTNTTIVCPATTSVIWRINVSYYAAA